MRVAALWLALATAHAGEARMIDFSGYRWLVRSSPEASGPGPNVFSDSTRNVWVDDAGALHLKITRDGDHWTCAEVTVVKPLGYGTYTLNFGSPVARLDDAAVFGYFTWSEDPAQQNREMDVELSKWAQAENQNAQFVVIPADEEKRRFDVPPVEPKSSYAFTWDRRRVLFGATASGTSLMRWDFSSVTVPDSIGARIKLNLWLFRGQPPKAGREVEVTVDSFSFRPNPLKP